MMTDITNCENHIECSAQSNQANNNLSTFVEGILQKIRTSYALHRQHKIDRDAFRNLLSLDETHLKDIGVSRNDIIWASKLALHENASKELERIRANNVATARFKSSRKVTRIK